MEYILFQYLWLIAILPKIAQLPILGSILLCLYVKESRSHSLKYDFKSDKYFILLIICNVIYAFSILVNALGGQYEFTRILAACNTFAITCIALGFYYFYSITELKMVKVEKYMFLNMNILFGLCLLYWLIGDKGNLPVIGELSGWDKVINDVNIGGVDTTRFLGYLEYSNMTVFMYLYCYAFSVDYLSRKVPKAVSVVIEVMYLLPLAAAHSRIGVACAAVMTVVSLVLTKMDRFTSYYLENKGKFWEIGIAVLVTISVIFYKPISGVLGRVLVYRGGSTATRTLIYVKSIEKMLVEAPIWGCGIKAIIPELSHPYGSHSTYIGMFYKIGILGGMLYLIATAVAIIGIVKRKERSKLDILMSFTFLALFSIALLEDLDGTNWNIVMFMSLMSLSIRNNHLQSVRSETNDSSLQNGTTENKAHLENTEQTQQNAD